MTEDEIVSVSRASEIGEATIQTMPLSPDLSWQPVVGQETWDLLERVFPGEDDAELRRSVIDVSSAILGRCADPHGPTEAETGLVIGYVQSGKTRSFTTVAALARDNQFQLVIVMTGTSTPLQSQSAKRLKQDLRLESRRDGGWAIFSNPNREDGIQALRDLLRDWNDVGVPPEQKRTALVVVMKNHSHLVNLRDLLNDLNLSRSPVLIIDDEADQASMNIKVRQQDESTIYQRICEVRTACPHHTFVQYTSTPQAPLLINLIDTLSPNFVRVLEPGDGYVGGREFFIGSRSKLVREIPDEDLNLDCDEVDGPPASLLEAMRVFFVGVAANSVNPKAAGSFRPRSMLVHPSHKTKQHSIYSSWATNAKSQWEHILGRSESDAAQELLEDFQTAYEDICTTEASIPAFDEIRMSLPRAIRTTRIVEVNAKDGQTPSVEWNNSDSWILVAGQAVDRGFTVEGLTVTYMPRGIGGGNADTLQQRGRFFGYKRDYLGYCRLYLSSNVANAFQRYVEHEEDVHRQLQDYQTSGVSLNQWKRAFIMDGSLRPTRRQVLSLDYMRGKLEKQWLRPTYPFSTPEVLGENRRIVDQFLAQLEMSPDSGHEKRTIGQRHLLATDVRLDSILSELLIPLRISASRDAQAFTGLRLQLQKALEEKSDETASVFLMSPNFPRERNIHERKWELFQGANPSKRDGSQELIYPGDSALHEQDSVTVQIHRLRLMGEDNRELAACVPVVAVWIPKRLAASWFVQDDSL